MGMEGVTERGGQADGTGGTGTYTYFLPTWIIAGTGIDTDLIRGVIERVVHIRFSRIPLGYHRACHLC